MSFEQSNSIKELATALVSFHKAVKKIAKGKTAKVGAYSYNYADLSSILEEIEKPLIENGLSIVQLPCCENELMTQLNHITGEWIRASYPMKPQQDTPQALGSAITYQRRYAIGALLCLDIDNDDDGTHASTAGSRPATQQTSKPAQPSPAADGSVRLTIKGVSVRTAKNGEEYTLIDTDELGKAFYWKVETGLVQGEIVNAEITKKRNNDGSMMITITHLERDRQLEDQHREEQMNMDDIDL